ncbi:MAG: hypothetical protein AAB664_04285 [Patescibacteria group bacterium]
MFHKRSWFPFVVVFLTIVLFGFFYVSYRSKSLSIKNAPATVSSISDELYKKNISIYIKSFFDKYPSAKDDAERTMLVQELFNQLLHMRVPMQEKDLHLELALSLQQMKDGLANHSQDLPEGFARLKDAVTQTSWLHL